MKTKPRSIRIPDDLYDEINDFANNNGLSIEVLDKKDIDVLYDIAKKDTYQSVSYYKSILNHFDSAELILVKLLNLIVPVIVPPVNFRYLSS